MTVAYTLANNFLLLLYANDYVVFYGPLAPEIKISHLTSPHPTSPHLTSPLLTSPHLTSPHPTSPHLTSPHLTSPHLTSPHLISSHLCLVREVGAKHRVHHGDVALLDRDHLRERLVRDAARINLAHLATAQRRLVVREVGGVRDRSLQSNWSSHKDNFKLNSMISCIYYNFMSIRCMNTQNINGLQDVSIIVI